MTTSARRLGAWLLILLLLPVAAAWAGDAGSSPGGELQWEYLYQNGQVREAQWYDPQGRLTARTLFADGRQTLSEGYRGDGSLEWQVRDLADARQEITRFGASRRPEMRYQAVAGRTDGPSTLFYPNGQPRQTVTFRAGVLHGSARTFYENGQVESDYAYRDGELDGSCRNYSADGRLTGETLYRQGVRRE